MFEFFLNNFKCTDEKILTTPLDALLQYSGDGEKPKVSYGPAGLYKTPYSACEKTGEYQYGVQNGSNAILHCFYYPDLQKLAEMFSKNDLFTVKDYLGMEEGKAYKILSTPDQDFIEKKINELNAPGIK